ncbi:Ig-like domain-containing protein [Eubacterium sp.]|uniref:Ig-like domain-containing protein n=1 Tax=Eubacterium sp. TaxID=142586 RepID=UPI0026DF086A|nr:Ig-like domain-containing protein [Eubacterium sp.]MDO5432598.1 Ig-like domain-containing protein [Eubacterium sp.]
MKAKTLSSRLIAGFLGLSLLASAAIPGGMPQAKAAEGAATFTAVADKTEVHPGGTFTVAVSVTPEPTVGSYEAALDYDHDKLEVADTTKSSYVFNFKPEGGGGSTGVYANWFDASASAPITETAELFTVTFKVKDGATGDAGLGMDPRVVGNAAAEDITANCSGTASSVNITEAPPAPVPVTGVSVSLDASELFPGQSAQATAAVEPAGADNPNVAWTSSDDAVATVGADGKVTAVAPGTASITATTEDGGFTASADVTVKADIVKALAVAAAPTKVDYLQGDAIDLTGGKLTITYEQAGDVEVDMAQATAIVDMNQVGEAVPVAIEFGGQKLENAFTINIKAATVTALELIQAPTGKTTVGDELPNLEGGMMKATINDGEAVREMPLSDAEITGYDKTKAGEQTLTATYGGKSFEFKITVAEASAGGSGTIDGNTDGKTPSNVKNPVTGLNFSQDEVNGFGFLTTGLAILVVSGIKVFRMRRKMQ